MSEAPQRRQPKQFQPPPWEIASEAGEGPLAAGREAEGRGEAKEVVAVVESSSADAPVKKEKVSVDDPRFVELMAQLSVAEASPNRHLWKAGVLSGLVLGSIGTMMLVWGVVATARTAQAGVAGMTGGAILMGFGMSFIGFSVWVIIRSLKQRGE
ncbi:MAG: hypothetical protein KGZ89_00900 [Actinobacteria bacterium]|nr:hypothetical protein [Actinomycetota bacterium]